MGEWGYYRCDPIGIDDTVWLSDLDRAVEEAKRWIAGFLANRVSHFRNRFV